MLRVSESMSECRENFKVAVRVRPRLPGEIEAESPQCVQVDHNCVIVSKPVARRRASSRIGIDDFGEVVRSAPSLIQSFTFDLVLGPSSTQDDVFQSCACDIVESVIEGYNGSIIASGQTSSGKTYTIEGGPIEHQGIIPRATQLIFSRIGLSSHRSDQYLVHTSYLQIYNEKISDLLDPSRDNLKIREDGVGGVFVESLSEHVVRDTEEVMRLIQNGARLRATSATRMNKESSRSHAVFTLIVEHAKHDGHGGSVITVGKLRLVDLAGSERLDVDAESKLQEETKNINVSLHNFSKVVTALTTPSVKHIPYRDSKLTRMLQDCLGGNCKTSLIATVTPVSECYSETMNTLKSAKRAKNIKNIAKVNQDMSEKVLITSYQNEIKKLRRELQDRSTDMSTEYIQLRKEQQEVQREKEDVMTKLEAQQKVADEAKADREKLIQQIQELEAKLLYGGSKKVSDSDEFKQALLKEQQRLKEEAALQFELKLAKLEKEKRRLECENLAIQQQVERFHHNPTIDSDKDYQEKGKVSGTHEVTTATRMTSAESQQLRGGIAVSQLPSKNTQDPEAAAALQEYKAALSHPLTGIPCQRLDSGIQIFNGSSAVHWFIQNMEGVSSIQNAQEVGQRLIDLGVFIEIQGRTTFIVSNTVYYQFCCTAHQKTSTKDYALSKRLMTTHSLGTFCHSSRLLQASRNFGMSSLRSISSSSILSSSVASLSISGDLVEHFGLIESYPSELHIKCLYGERLKVKALLSQRNINSTDGHGRTPLMYAVIGKQSKCCVMLVRYGAEVNAMDYSGVTAILLAAKYEYEDIIKILLKSGAETHHTDSNGQTVFHLAALSQKYKCLEYLCKYGTSAGMNTRDNTYRTPLLTAVQAMLPGHVQRLLIAKADLGISDNQGRTALHYAVECNTLPCAQAIVETNANDINLIDTAGMSALHLACIKGTPAIVYYLSSFPSCDINLQDEQGKSALHYAVLANRADITQVLLSKGASVVIKDNRNKTPLQYSKEMGLDECTKILQTT